MDLFSNLDLWEKIAALIISLFSSLWAFIKFGKFLLKRIKMTNKKVASFIDLIPELERMTEQFKPNGGKSIVDLLKRLEDGLAHTDQKLKVIASSMGISAFEADSKGLYTFVSKQWSDLTGFSYLEAMGNNWINIVEEDFRDEIFEEWKNSIAQNREFHSTIRLTRSGNEASIVAWPIRNLDGSVEKFFGILM